MFRIIKAAVTIKIASTNNTNSISFKGEKLSRERSLNNLKSSRMRFGQVHSKSSSRNISSARNSFRAEENLRDRKEDQELFQKFSKDLAEVLNEMQNGWEIDENSMKFIIELIKTTENHNIDSITLKSTEIDIKEFWIILIKLGFINLNPEKDCNKLILSKNNFQESTYCDSFYNSYQSKWNSKARCDESDWYSNEVKLWSIIWKNLKGNEKGFISLRNLKIFMLAVMNLWFGWMKEPQNNSGKSSRSRKNYQILNKQNKRTFSGLNKENSIDSQNMSQRSFYSSFR